MGNQPTKTVIHIIREHLAAIGADGLVCPDADCGCKLDDLAPCCSDISDCQPGWASPAMDDDEWRMWTTKERAELETKSHWAPLVDPAVIEHDQPAPAAYPQLDGTTSSEHQTHPQKPIPGTPEMKEQTNG